MISFLASLDEWGFPAMRYLLSALWQSSLLFAATFALAYFLRRRRAAVRHAVWALALLMAPTLPLLTRGFERAGAPQMRLTMLPAYHNDEGRMMNDEWKRNISLPGSGVSENTASAKNPGASLAGAETGLETMPRAGMRTIFNYPWALGLIAYAAGLSLFLIWIVLGRLRIRQWIGAAMPATDERVLAAFRHAREALRFHRACLALQSPRVPVPISVGILHSRVLLPSTLAPRLSDEELRAVALHETAHLSRHDPLVLTLAALVRAALFFHPLVWLAARQVSALAEHCADDAVLDATGRPLPYAEMLARLAEDLPERPFAAEMATGILLSKGAFLRRVEAILGDRDRARRLTRRALAATAAAVLLSIAVALAIPLGEKGSDAKKGELYENARASSKDLKVKAGPNAFALTIVERNDRNGHIRYEDGKGLKVGDIAMPVAPNMEKQAAWLDMANVHFQVVGGGEQSRLLYDIIEMRVFDHETRQLLKAEGERTGVFWDASDYLLAQMYSMGKPLPNKVDVWFRAASYPNANDRVLLEPKSGRSFGFAEGTLTIREIKEGQWGFSSSNGQIQWKHEPRVKRGFTLLLDFTGKWVEGRYQVRAMHQQGAGSSPSSLDYVDFSKNAGPQVVYFDMPLQGVSWIELRPFGGRHTFYFDGVQLPKISPTPLAAPPVLSFQVDGKEVNQDSEAPSPIRARIITINGDADGFNTQIPLDGFTREIYLSEYGPPRKLNEYATILLVFRGLWDSKITVGLLDRNGQPVPAKSIHMSKETKSGGPQGTFFSCGKDIPLEKIGSVEVFLGGDKGDPSRPRVRVPGNEASRTGASAAAPGVATSETLQSKTDQARVNPIEASPMAPEIQSEIESLRSSDPNLRGRGAFLLGEMKEKAAPAIPMLVSLLGDDKQSDFEANGNMHNSHVYDEAATALGKIGVQAIEPLIAKLAEVGSASDKAAEALAHIGEPAVAALTTALKDDNDRVRAKAAGVLARTGGISLENLLQALNDKDQGTRAAVAEGLRWTEDARATKALIDLLNDENSKVRACAASALGRAGNKAAVGPLIGRLNDKDMQVRVNATHALGKIGDKGAVASLLAITRGESEGYRDGAFQALRMIGDPDSAEAVAKLIEASDPGARLESLRTLGDLNHPLAFEAPQSAKPVTDLLLNKKEDPAVRSAAAGTLRLYRDPYAMDALETVLKDNAESEDLRSRAAKSLGRLGTPGIERLMNLEQSNDVELKRLATTGLKEILVTSSYPDARYTLWWEVYMDALREVVGALATPAELDAVAKGPELPLAAAEKHPNPHIRSVAPLVEKIAEEEWDLHPLLRRLGKPNYPDSYPWGEAVNRVQCRLRMRQLDFWEWNRFGGETLWTGDDAPQIKMDIRNQGTLDLNCSVPPSQLRLEVDGVEYGRPRTETPGPQIPLWPGQQRNAFRVVLDKKWLREGKPLVWNAGRHTVRVVVQLNPTAGENFAVYSNPIELETYPSGKERYELQNFRIEAGFVPDRNEIQAGEELGVEFYVRNVGDAAFGLRVGGDGRGVRPTRFKINAVDADGNKVTDPNANAMNMGGFGGCPMIEPGKSYAESLFLSKWCEFVKPGVYTVTCTSVLKISKDGTSDFDERKMLQLPIETRFTLTVKEPAANQAREKVESMLKNRDKADFSILRSPVYLPVLGEYAAKEDGDAVKGIGSIHSPEATKALIALAEDWLKRGKTDLALQAIRPLRSRLPNPGWYPADQSKASGDKYFAPDRERVERTWRAEFAGPMRGMARRLVRNTDQESLETAGYILQCVGTAEDLPDLMIGYTNAIEATKTLPFETHQYFRPRGASYRYRFAAELLIGRGGAVPEKPNTPGEAATYLIAMQAKKDFRPADWPQQVLRWLDYATPYMREFVLDFMPDPIPDAALDKIPALLADPYVDLQIAACHTAQKHPRETFREPLLAILNKGTEQYLLNAAAAAAPANGIPTDQFMEIWVRRMDRNDLGTKAVIRLLLAILDNNQRGDPQDLSAEATAAAQARWKRFIEENREKLRQGKRFKIGDPEITPDLFPPGFSWYKDNKPWPPQNDPSSSAVTGTKRSPGAESVANFTAARKVSDPPTTVTADVQSEPERLVARSAEGVPQEEGMAALEEILKLRETRDAKYVPALEKILEANMDSGRTHGFAAAQALFCIGTPEARSVLDRYLLTPRYNTWLGIRYATYQKMAEPQRSDFVRQYYLKNLSQDLAVELAAAPKWDKEGARIEFTLTLRNSSDKALRILEQQVYPGRMLSFQDEAGRIAPPVEIAVGRLSRTKWVELVPSATHQYTIPVRIRRVDPQGKYPYPGLSPDAELFAETGDLIFDIVRKGRSQVYAMVEAQPPPKAQLEKLDFNNLWTGRAVSKPIEVDISLTPPVRAVSNPDGLSPPAEGKSADKANPGFLADLPEFRDLDTSVTKETLKRMIADKGLRNIWTSEDRVTKTCHVYRGDGENVVVTFRDGKCSGIQRMRKDASYADKLFNGLGKQARSLQVSLRADKKVWKAGEDLALKADVRNAGQEDVAIYQDGNNAWEIEMDGQWYWPTGATTALPALLAPGEKILDISVPPTWIKPLDWRAKSDADPVAGRGKLLTLEPGRHTVRVATYPEMYSVDAEGRPLTLVPSPGRTRRVVRTIQQTPGKPVRAVSNPVEIEVLSAESGAALPQERVRMEGDFAVGRELTLGDHRCGSFREGSSIE